jgi:hypothetical protein
VKFKVKYDNENNPLIEFIKETKEGKHSDNKPEIVDFKYRRILIQEQEDGFALENEQENNLLFGLTY